MPLKTLTFDVQFTVGGHKTATTSQHTGGAPAVTFTQENEIFSRTRDVAKLHVRLSRIRSRKEEARNPVVLAVVINQKSVISSS